MAKKRRGGFKGPELRGTLGTLLRSALQQAGGVRDALERGAREGRTRLDNFRADRQRADLLADLGELVLDLIRRGEIDLGELPEARDLIAQLDDLDAEAEARERGDDDEERDDDRVYVVPNQRSRERFDTRGPNRPASGPRDTDDGTVGSSRWAPPKPKARDQRVWRPVPADAVSATPDPGLADPPSDLPSARVIQLPKHPHRGGGISFDDDDLGDYMHPDDVPPKPRGDD